MNEGDKGFSIGKVFYKLRMRKSIEEAVKWYQQKRAMRISRDPASLALSQNNGNKNGKARSKVVIIQVLRCHDLKRPEQLNKGRGQDADMQPFFHF
jgi:hypothetical protein